MGGNIQFLMRCVYKKQHPGGGSYAVHFHMVNPTTKEADGRTDLRVMVESDAADSYEVGKNYGMALNLYTSSE